MLPCNWRAGLAEVVEQGVFVTPPVDGWIYAVGRDVAVLTADPEQIEASVVALSAEFGEAYWFAADDGREVYGWARGERGRCTRAYAFAEETGPFLWFGEITDAERQLGCFVDDPRDRSDDEVKWWPDRAVVCAVAALWAADPSKIGGADESSAGLVGRC